MDRRLATIELFTKDYTTLEKGSMTFSGEVIEQDDDFRQYFYRFYGTESGIINVEINFKEDTIKVIEKNDVVYMVLFLKENEVKNCTYEFLDNGMKLELKTRLVQSNLEMECVELVYDIYDSKNEEQPITRNVLTIKSEANKKVC